MKIKFATPLALFALLIMVVPIKASTPATFVNFNAANATISGSNYITLPITFLSTTTGRWNFDPTLTTPLVPATTTTPAIYGGLNIAATGTGTFGTNPYARMHNNNPPGFPNAPKIFLVSDAGSSGSINNVNMLYLWKRSSFTGNQSTYSDNFNSSSTLSVHITDDTTSSGGNAIETRFIVLNGSTYYVSEAKATATGTFTLTNFNNNTAAGFRWAPIAAPTSTSFDIPQSGLVYAAQTFGNVQAVGWIGRGSRSFSSLYAFDTFSATGIYNMPVMKLSMNLSGVSSFDPGQPFLDVFKYAGSWITANADDVTSYTEPWSTNLTGTYGLTLDSNGWPTKLPFTQNLITPAYTGEKPDNRTTPATPVSSLQYVHTLVKIYEPGRYRLRLRGTGSFAIQATNSSGTSLFQTFFGPPVTGSNNPTATGTLTIDNDGAYFWDTPPITLSPTVGPATIYLSIYGSDPNSTGDYIRNVEILSPSTFTAGFKGDSLNRITGPFNPDFTATLHNFATLRMMDWGATNQSPIKNWTDRTLPTTFTQALGTTTGVALEYQIAICNTLGENIWVNVPHMATQDYIQKLAWVLHNGSKADGTPYVPGTDAPSTLVWPGLNAGLKVYIEYSNETWNSGHFPAQYNWCQTQGYNLHFPAGSYGDFYMAYQSANIWQWFYNEWGTDAPKRLVRVLASQFTTANASTRLSGFTAGILDPAAQTQYPDALAVAPYFAASLADALVPTYVNADGSVNTATSATVVTNLAQSDESNVITTLGNIKTIADSYGVNLNCYEGGQSLAATTTANIDNTYLTADLINANRDASMGTLYNTYLSDMKSKGVAEFCNFSHLGPWDKHGCWSVIEYLGQSSTLTPKYNALVAYQTANPNANSNIPPLLDLTSTLSGTVVNVPAAVVDTTGAGSAVVPLSTAYSVDYDGAVVSTQWTVNGVAQSTTSNAISPTLPVGNNAITVTVTDNSGASTTDTIQILVRPHGSDTVVAQSNFTGAGGSTTTPWTPTSTLTTGLGYTGWSFIQSSSGISARVSDSSLPNANALRVLLNNPYPSSGSPNNTVPELLTDAVTQKQYLAVTVTPPAGHSLDLRGANIQWTLSPTTIQSARQTGLFVGVGGLAAIPPVASEVYDSSAQYVNGITSPDTFNYYFPLTSTYSAVTQPIEIRIYFYGNVFNFKEMQLNSFKLTGIYH